MKYKVLQGDGPPTETQLEELAKDGWALAALVCVPNPATLKKDWLIYLTRVD